LITVVDTNSLIGLAKGGVLHFLPELFDVVRIPSAVFNEVAVAGAGRPGAAEVTVARDKWLTVETPPPPGHQLQAANLAPADRELLSLAGAVHANWVITDDRPARAVAQSMGLQPVHTVELVLAMRQLQLIPLCRVVLERMRAADFGIRDDLYEAVLRLAGEL